MSSAELRISPDLALPLDAVTDTFALIAKRRVGKSNAAVVMFEQMYDAGIPAVAVDSKGDWWGVRSSADGRHDGLSVVVFGGEHADVPLSPDAGAYMADLIAEQRLTCVLDVSQFSKAEEVKFLYAFATRLLKVNHDPLHLFLEECDDYIPQSMVHGQIGGITEAQLVRAFSKLVRQGGFKGIGCTLITQRPALVSNNVLSQVETMMLLRTTMPTDVETVGKWVKGHPMAKEIIASLPSLKVGEAWVVSPAFLELVQRVTFARRRTFDSGATPKIGEKRREPTRLADVDLATIKEQMAETIEKAKADDPKELRKQIRELEKKLHERAPETVTETVLERVEVPVISDEQVARLEAAMEQYVEGAQTVQGVVDGLADAMWSVKDAEEAVRRTRPARDRARAVADRPRPNRPAQRSDPPLRREPRRAPVQRSAPAEGLTGPQQRVLDAIAWWNAVGFPRPTKLQVGFIAGYRVGKKVGGTYGNVLGSLRAAALLDYPADGVVELTAEGQAVAGEANIEPTTEGLQAAVMDRLDGPEQRVLQVLIDEYPEDLSKQEVGEAAGYTVGEKVGGTFGNVLGRLRSLGLIDYPAPGRAVACEVLFL